MNGATKAMTPEPTREKVWRTPRGWLIEKYKRKYLVHRWGSRSSPRWNWEYVEDFPTRSEARSFVLAQAANETTPPPEPGR